VCTVKCVGDIYIIPKHKLKRIVSKKHYFFILVLLLLLLLLKIKGLIAMVIRARGKVHRRAQGRGKARPRN